MIRPLTATLTALGLLAATPSWACLPPPPNASNDTSMARAVFVGRVTAVEQTDPADCLAAVRAQSNSAPRQGDPGEQVCEAFGFATLEPVRIIKGEDVVTGPARVAWNSVRSCAIGWTAEVGHLAIVTVSDGGTATVQGSHQYEPLFRTILDLVAETRP